MSLARAVSFRFLDSAAPSLLIQRLLVFLSAQSSVYKLLFCAFISLPLCLSVPLSLTDRQRTSRTSISTHEPMAND